MDEYVARVQSLGCGDVSSFTLGSKRSWVVLAKAFLPADAESFDAAWEHRPSSKPTGVIMGKAVTFPRRTCAFGKDYTFAGQTAKTAEKRFTLSNLYTNKLSMVADTPPNGTLVNWYDATDGDYIGPHSDDERSLIKNTPIFSISWCKPDSHFRRFRLTPKSADGGTALTLELGNGDLVIMGGTCQATHKHEIMKTRKRQRDECIGRRINQTDRYFSE